MGDEMKRSKFLKRGHISVDPVRLKRGKYYKEILTSVPKGWVKRPGYIYLDPPTPAQAALLKALDAFERFFEAQKRKKRKKK
jgi:hypothetical protein